MLLGLIQRTQHQCRREGGTFAAGVRPFRTWEGRILCQEPGHGTEGIRVGADTERSIDWRWADRSPVSTRNSRSWAENKGKDGGLGSARNGHLYNVSDPQRLSARH